MRNVLWNLTKTDFSHLLEVADICFVFFFFANVLKNMSHSLLINYAKKVKWKSTDGFSGEKRKLN